MPRFTVHCIIILLKGCLYTEWFDIDEPCYDGDTESATQNMAMVNSLPQTGRFRMCPRIRQVGEPQFRTIEGGEIPQEQKVLKDFEAQRLTCLNKDQTTKPGPPNHWFDLQVRCRDYKMRHVVNFEIKVKTFNEPSFFQTLLSVFVWMLSKDQRPVEGRYATDRAFIRRM